MYIENLGPAKNMRDLIHTRPEMFIGQNKWDNEALQLLMMLVIRQAVEPVSLNQCSIVKVSLEPEDTILIKDNGRGLPVVPPSRFPKSDAAALTRLLEWYMPTGIPTKEHYEEYGFLGYLALLLNVLSEALRIDTVWQAQVYMVSCSRGDIITPLQKTDDGTLKQGTRIRFKPDPDVFPSPAFSEDSLKVGIDELASEFPQIKFEFSAIGGD